MRTMTQLAAAVKAVLKGDGRVAIEVQSIVLENMRHAQEHGDVSPCEALLKGLSGKRQLQKWAFAHYPLRWKKDESGTLRLALREKREATDWQHEEAAKVLWSEFEKVKKPEVVKGLKDLSKLLKRVVDGESWTPEAKKAAEKCLELVEEKSVTKVKAVTPELVAQIAAFLQAS